MLRLQGRLREITFCHPCDGQVYVYLTSEMTPEPGLLVLLYKTRWEIEKVFDETKTKLAEKKSWATSDTAKEMQAHFVAIVHNLLLLMADWHEAQGVENAAEKKRRDQRQEQQKAALKKTGGTLPLIYTLRQRFTQATFKLIRWLLESTGIARPRSRKPCSTSTASTPDFNPAIRTPMGFCVFCAFLRLWRWRQVAAVVVVASLKT